MCKKKKKKTDKNFTLCKKFLQTYLHFIQNFKNYKEDFAINKKECRMKLNFVFLLTFDKKLQN